MRSPCPPFPLPGAPRRARVRPRARAAAAFREALGVTVSSWHRDVPGRRRSTDGRTRRHRRRSSSDQRVTPRSLRNHAASARADARPRRKRGRERVSLDQGRLLPFDGAARAIPLLRRGDLRRPGLLPGTRWGRVHSFRRASFDQSTHRRNLGVSTIISNYLTIRDAARRVPRDDSSAPARRFAELERACDERASLRTAPHWNGYGCPTRPEHLSLDHVLECGARWRRAPPLPRCNCRSPGDGRGRSLPNQRGGRFASRGRRASGVRVPSGAAGRLAHLSPASRRAVWPRHRRAAGPQSSRHAGITWRWRHTGAQWRERGGTRIAPG